MRSVFDRFKKKKGLAEDDFVKRYTQLLESINKEGAVDGEYLSPEDRKEAFLRRKDPINFNKFIGKVEEKRKQSVDKGQSPQFTSGPPPVADDVAAIKPEQKLLPGTAAPGSAVSEAAGWDKNIDQTLDEILAEIKAENKADRAYAKKKDKEEEDKLRQEKEAKKEKAKQLLMAPIQKALAPVKSFWDNLLGTIGELIVSKALVKLVEWFSDPENRKKAFALFRFVKDWWPGIVGGILAVQAVIAGLALWAAGPILLGALVAIGKIALVLAPLIALAKLGEKFQKPRVEADAQTVETKIDAGADPYESQFRTPDAGGPGSINDMNQKMLNPTAIPGDFDHRGGGDFNMFAEGGQVPGSGDSDTVPALLTPGEFVMTKNAVQEYGSETLASMNAAAGGTNRTNKPKDGKYQVGGEVQKMKLPGLGGGGGGTDSLTEQAKVKTTKGYVLGALDRLTGNLFDFDKHNQLMDDQAWDLEIKAKRVNNHPSLASMYTKGNTIDQFLPVILPNLIKDVSQFITGKGKSPEGSPAANLGTSPIKDISTLGVTNAPPDPGGQLVSIETGQPIQTQGGSNIPKGDISLSSVDTQNSTLMGMHALYNLGGDS